MKLQLPTKKGRKFLVLILFHFFVLNVHAQIFHQGISKKQLPLNNRTNKRSTSKRSPTDFVRCSTIEADAFLRARYPSIPSITLIEREFQKNILSYKKELRHSRTEATVVTIPVIVHVIHSGEAVGSGSNITAAQVKSQIDVLNEDYRRKPGTLGFNDNPIGADVTRKAAR
jgi:hypothetical protein